MEVVLKNRVRLSFGDHGHGPPVVLLHGLGCDRSFFAPQVAHLHGRYRLIVPDLRGHGESDAPRDEARYSVVALASDIALLCDELQLDQPVVVGHSLGGNIALEMAKRDAGVVRSALLIDSLFFPPEEKIGILSGVAAGFRTKEFREVVFKALAGFFLETDDPVRAESIMARVATTRPYVMAAGLTDIHRKNPWFRAFLDPGVSATQ